MRSRTLGVLIFSLGLFCVWSVSLHVQAYSAISLSQNGSSFEWHVIRSSCTDPQFIGIYVPADPLVRLNMEFHKFACFDDFQFFSTGHVSDTQVNASFTMSNRLVYGFDTNRMEWLNVPAVPAHYTQIHALDLVNARESTFTDDLADDQLFALFAVVSDASSTVYSLIQWNWESGAWTVLPGQIPTPVSISPHLSVGGFRAVISGSWPGPANACGPSVALLSGPHDAWVLLYPEVAAPPVCARGVNALMTARDEVLLGTQMMINGSMIPFQIMFQNGSWDPYTTDFARHSGAFSASILYYSGIGDISIVAGDCGAGTCFYTRYWPEYLWSDISEWQFPESAYKAKALRFDWDVHGNYWLTAKTIRETAALYTFSDEENQWVVKLQDNSGRAGFLSWAAPDSSLPCQSRKPPPGPEHHSDDDHTAAIIGGVVGGIVGLFAILAIIWMVVKRRKQPSYHTVV
eukprot:ANDGO_01659.mRNA.1 hypothetical protein